MGSRYRRKAAAAALVLSMVGIVAAVVLTPLGWRGGTARGPASDAAAAKANVGEVTAPSFDVDATPAPASPASPAAAVGTAVASSAAEAEALLAGVASVRIVTRPGARARQDPRVRPAASSVEKPGKAKGHEKVAHARGHAKPPKAKSHDKPAKVTGHEKKALGWGKPGKQKHHPQGSPGKKHGGGKGKQRDRAPARARG